jgi:hypothetical protein
MENLKIFISWSGERSEIVAAALNEWLPMVIQNVEPQFSRENEKGTFWQTGIRKALATDFGIVCLTPENLSTPWVHFEAGSLAKHEDGRVWTLLLCGLEYGSVTPPLSLLHHTLPDEGDVFKMLESINKACGSASLKPDVLRKVFNKNWPDLKTAVDKAAGMKPSGATPAKRNPSDMIEEILLTTRQLLVRSRERKRIPLQAGAPSEFLTDHDILIQSIQIFSIRVEHKPEEVTSDQYNSALGWRTEIGPIAGLSRQLSEAKDLLDFALNRIGMYWISKGDDRAIALKG